MEGGERGMEARVVLVIRVKWKVKSSCVMFLDCLDSIRVPFLFGACVHFECRQNSWIINFGHI